jgi:SAM-dependent methyltransferase
MPDITMYGSEQNDVIVKYFDLAFGIGGEPERDWYLGKVRQSGGPVLDLACGTGRLSLPIAKEGFEVWAVYQSEGMLNQFREKLRDEPIEVWKNIHIENQKMSDFRLGRKFSTILCCDAFIHNLTVDEEMSCLQKVIEHLTPGGRFVFNLPNMSQNFRLQVAASNQPTFRERGRYQLPDGTGSILVEQANIGDIKTQFVISTLRITRFDAAGSLIEQGESTWSSRFLLRSEIDQLLKRCGFKVISLVGNYRNDPITRESQLIFVPGKISIPKFPFLVV